MLLVHCLNFRRKNGFVKALYEDETEKLIKSVSGFRELLIMHF